MLKAGADGRTVRLRDVARIELGALGYTTNSFLLRKSAVAMLVTQRPGSNALATAEEYLRHHGGAEDELSARARLQYRLQSDRVHRPVGQRADQDIYEAMVLVVIVVLVFLQGWRPAIIPIVAIPVSLIGTFAVMAALGFSINNLTLFGLVLAVGIVVDDAIVVVENVERHLAHGMSRRNAALRPWRRSVGRWSRLRWCCARCSCRPRSSAVFPGSSSSSSPSPSRSRPRSPASVR